jgi:hypothetical protein
MLPPPSTASAFCGLVDHNDDDRDIRDFDTLFATVFRLLFVLIVVVEGTNDMIE